MLKFGYFCVIDFLVVFQMLKFGYFLHIRKNMTDEQKQKYKEARKHKYHNMTDEQKQKQKDYQKNIEKA